MSSIHEGVSCDICTKSNFSGKRYKCLICYDFDQCETCHEQSINSTLTLSKPINPTHNHVNTHPMQCILTKIDLEMFYGVPNASVDYGEQISFTCPYCGKNGFSESTLCDHLSNTHLNNLQNESLPTEVVCPICAALPNRACAGDPNHLTEDFQNHLNLEHVTPRNLLDIGSDTLGSGSVAAAAALRFSRRLNYAQNASSSGRGISIGRNNTFRFQLNNSSSNSSALSSFMRSAGSGIDSFVTSGSVGGSDPIVELLSQLTGVRRATSNSHANSFTLSQLTRDRENLHQPSSRHHIFSGSNSSKIGLSGKLSSGAIQSSGQNTSSQSSNQNQQSMQQINQLLELPNCLLQQPLPVNARDSRFLLSK